MSIIGATRLQNDKSDTYSAGPCYAGGCSAFTPRGTCGKDWDLGEQTCASGFCTSQPLCARIKKTQVCGLRYSSKGKDPLVSAEWDSRGAPYVRCTYDADLIDTQAQVDQFMSMFGESPGLAERYCMRGVKNTAGELVSRVSSDADPAGGWCRKWYSAHRGPDQDAALGSFCIKNPGAADCKCINRASDPVYQKVKTLHAYPDQCWYVPCAADVGELKMGTQRDTPTNCPTQVCQIVFNMLDDGSVTMDDVKNTINCDFSKYVPPPPPPKPTPLTPLTPPKPTPPTPTPLTPPKPTPPTPPTPTPPTPPRPAPNRKIMFFVAGAVLVAILISTVRW
ncbi:myristylated membrane protein [Tiger frog virus]|uniref:Myristylated membrane protein n=1 Tax=Rana tigrina ranavirus TaxID=160691 RepID=A0A8A4YIQ2_RTRV|nr:myristylated membrane protein [Tiger frog virus]